MNHTQQSETGGYVEISKEAVSFNIRQILSVGRDAGRVYFVVKSNAYGHGIHPIIRQIIHHDCRRVAVEASRDAIRIRKLGFTGEILILNPVAVPNMPACLQSDCTITVNCMEQVSLLENQCRKLNHPCRIHLKLDLGLRRIGSSKDRIIRIAEAANRHSCLRVEGLYGHPTYHSAYRGEYEQLRSVSLILVDSGVPLKSVHYGNSSVFLHQPDIALQGMRIGTLLYGVLPPDAQQSADDHMKFRPVMSVKTHIIQIHKIQKGECFGYNSHTGPDRESRIAVIPMGYANGLDRRYVSKEIHVLVNGVRAPMCGDIFMNTSYVDVSGIPHCRIGDEIVLIGQQGDEEITLTEIAEKMKTIPAEIMVRMGNRNELER